MATSTTRTLTTKRKRTDKGGRVFYWSMLVLPLLQFIIFYIIVNFNSVLMAFKEYNTLTFETSFSLNNFKYWFTNQTWPTLVICFKNSFKYFLLTLLTVPVSLFISYYIYKKYVMSQFFKIIMFIPSIICISAFAIMYKFFINNGLSFLFKGETPIEAVYNQYREPMIIVFYLLMCFSCNILLYINAMGHINPNVIEASKIDGASEFRIFFNIVIPQIWGTLVSLLVIFMAGIVTNQAYLFNFFGITAETEMQTVGYFIFKSIQEGATPNVEASYYLVSALGLMLTVVVAPFTIIVRKLLTKYGPSED